MEKDKTIPVCIAVNETREKLAADINSSALPPALLEPILANFYNQIAFAAEKELSAAKAKLSETEKPEEGGDDE